MGESEPYFRTPWWSQPTKVLSGLDLLIIEKMLFLCRIQFIEAALECNKKKRNNYINSNQMKLDKKVKKKNHSL